MDVIALDIGGSKIKAAILTNGLKIKKSVRVSTPKTKAAFLKRVEVIVSSLMSKQVRRIGISLPGLVSESGRITFGGTALSFLVGMNIKKFFSRFSVPVVIENDAQCFTLAESFFGAAKGYTRALGIIWGTGIGSGYVNGDPSIGSIMEIGHIPLLDVNGNLSTLEKLASGLSIERAYKKATGKHKLVHEIYLSKDGKKFIHQAIDALGRGLAIAIDMLKPDVIVLGGGVSNLPVVKDVEKIVKRRALPTHTKHLKIKRFAISDDAGLYGAALLALRL